VSKRWCYSSGLLKAYKSPLHTVVIGNLSMGGTGKTPFAIYLIESFIEQKAKVAYLSRGYGRSSKGLRVVEGDSNVSDAGDEAITVKMRFPSLDVVVCENRREGLEYIKEATDASVVIMDDAFQHMRVKAEFYFLLTTYEKPFYRDSVFPLGTLREPRRFAKTAQSIVVTKCPDGLEAESKSRIENKIKNYSEQSVLFSQINYATVLYAVSGVSGMPLTQVGAAIAFAGTASNEIFFKQVGRQFQLLDQLSFADHHNYSLSDIRRIKKMFEGVSFSGPGDLIILTTEKDAARLRTKAFEQEFGTIPLFYWPINAGFDNQSKNKIDKIVDQLC